MRIKFIGPAGAKFAGVELVGIQDTQRARSDAIAAAEFATGYKLRELVERTSQSEGLTAQLTLFMTLRNAGFWVTWDEVGAITGEDYDVIVEPSDPVASTAADAADASDASDASDANLDEAADPTSARTVSVPGAAPAEVERVKPVRAGSKRKSAAGS